MTSIRPSHWLALWPTQRYRCFCGDTAAQKSQAWDGAGVDTGGPFIDFYLLNEATQELRSLKVLTTPDKPGRECRRSQPPITAAS